MHDARVPPAVAPRSSPAAVSVMAPSSTANTARRRTLSASIRDMRLWLGAYAVALAMIAFWPVPVDSGAGPLLRAITAAVPWLTYDLIEFSANVLLFVPLGALLALVIPRRRMLVLPVALFSTIIIEAGQALLLSARTPSLRDIVANFSGAAIGLLIVWLLERRRAAR